MNKQRGKAGLAGNDADASACGKRRKSSRAKHGATSQPRLTGRRRRSSQPAVAAAVPETRIVGASAPAVEAASARQTANAPPLPVSAAPDAIPVAPAVQADVAIATAVPDHDPIVEAVPSGEAAASQLGDASGPVDAPSVAAQDLSSEPAVSPDIVRNPLRSHRTRSFVVRWASAAAIVATCLLAPGRLSDMQVSAHVVSDASQAAPPHPPAEAVPDAGLPPLQVASLSAPPASADPVAPPAADPPPQNLAATIAPSAKQHLQVRDGNAARRVAKPRAPASKPIASETAAAPPPATRAQAQLTGRAHAVGRYEMRWGTARLHEDPNADNAQGPSWDFVASTGAQ